MRTAVQILSVYAVIIVVVSIGSMLLSWGQPMEITPSLTTIIAQLPLLALGVCALLYIVRHR